MVYRGEFFLGVPTGVSPARAGAFPQLHQRHDDSCLRDGDLLQLGLGAHGGSQGLALCTHRGQRAFLLWLHGLVSHHTDSGAVRRAGFAVLATLNMEYASCPEEGKTVYLGAVAVVSNLMGYMATLAASGIQSTLEHSIGTERSISVLFAISAAGMLACLWHARKNLPKI